jgi:hypothetical protein
MDEGDSKTKIQTAPKKGDQTNVIQGHIPDAGDVFSTFWVRCPIQINNGPNRFVLDSRYRILFNLSILFYILLFAYEAFK